MKYKKILEILKKIPLIMPDVLAICGTASISIGCFMISEVVGFIIVGLFLITGAVILSKV